MDACIYTGSADGNGSWKEEYANTDVEASAVRSLPWLPGLSWNCAMLLAVYPTNSSD